MSQATLAHPSPLLGDLAGLDPLEEPSITGLLIAKPDDDAVPPTVWWLTAQLLRSSVAANAALLGEAATADVRRAVGAALLFADLALDELADATGVGRVPALTDSVPAPPSRAAGARGLRHSALPLTRLLMGSVPTPPASLAVALGRHRRNLLRCQALLRP